VRRRVSIRSEQITAGEVFDTYEMIRDIIVRDAEVARSQFGGDSNLRDARLFGMTLGELDRHFEGLLDEVDEQTSLFIIAAAEAEIRVDFENRVVRRKPKDSITRAFRDIATDRGERVPLEDILDVWAEKVPSAKTDVSRFKGALVYRHWLAHGRYWVSKHGENYHPSGLSLIIESLLAKTSLGDVGTKRDS